MSVCTLNWLGGLMSGWEWSAVTVQEGPFCVTHLEEHKCHAFPISRHETKLREGAEMLSVGQDHRRSQ